MPLDHSVHGVRRIRVRASEQRMSDTLVVLKSRTMHIPGIPDMSKQIWNCVSWNTPSHDVLWDYS